MAWRRAVGGVAVALLWATAAGAQAPAPVPMERVPVKPMVPAPERWVPAKRATCIDVARIGGAVVVDGRTIDVVMRGGRRWRLTLAAQCPQLSYYGGFYYQPRKPGLMCAGQDRILSRAGGSCRVARIHALRQLAPR